jgi:synaptobrevin family protein YKT6
MCHVYVRADNLSAVLISDHEYPRRVAHTLITKMMDEFALKYLPSTWSTLKEITTDFPQINIYLAKYQNPIEADAITKMQNDLDETKIILVRINLFFFFVFLFLKNNS